MQLKAFDTTHYNQFISIMMNSTVVISNQISTGFIVNFSWNTIPSQVIANHLHKVISYFCGYKNNFSVICVFLSVYRNFLDHNLSFNA